jgi:uncharacterized protein involved in response to NO
MVGMIQVSAPPQPPPSLALWNLGFRPFFLGAMGYALLSMLQWLGALSLGWGGLDAVGHAHEMIFGYAHAVAAGFLLTAIGNWTGLQTPHGRPLMALFALWLAARLLWLGGQGDLPLTALFDLGFGFALLLAASAPILRKRQWSHVGLLALLAGLALANAASYLGGHLDNGGLARIGPFSGLYLLLTLILVMGRRVIPFFIERGVEGGARLRQRAWLDGVILGGFGLFAVADLAGQARLAAPVALLLVGCNLLRLWDWHTPGIWRKPLLWSLYLAYAALVAGLALYAARIVVAPNPFLSIHAFTYGAIGLMTTGMMARVALGHTGRNVFAPPAGVAWVFTLLLAGLGFRVGVPLFWPALYAAWMLIAQLLWLATFALLLWFYAAMLLRPRLDGRYG